MERGVQQTDSLADGQVPFIVRVPWWGALPPEPLVNIIIHTL